LSATIPSKTGRRIPQGWEFSYQQQFTFLPGLLSGLGASANYTIIGTHGNFGETTRLGTNEVAGFIPETGMAILSWRHQKFSARVLYKFTGDYITSYDAVSVGRNLYRYSYKTITLGVAYQYRPSLGFTFDVGNLTNEPQRFYRGHRDQMQNTTINGTTLTFGVNGRF
jgi:iron complex outermembrane recepter protein